MRKVPLLRTLAKASILKNVTYRTKCHKIIFDTCDKYDSGSSVIVTLASLGQQTHTRARIIFLTRVSKSTISTLNFIRNLILYIAGIGTY